MVRDPAKLDLAAVERFMDAHVAGFQGPVSARKYSDGQSNPTYELTTASRSYVLRRKPMGALLKSAHAVDREFRVQKALLATEVPVAEVLALCEDESVLGAAFYVMAHVPGEIYFDPRFPGKPEHEKAIIFNEMARVLAAIHQVDLARQELTDFGAPGNYVARQTRRWSKQYWASQTATIPEMDHLIEALDQRIAAGAGEGDRSLVHGDFRIDNLIFSPKGQIVAVLDWELSTVGHPLADLASVIMQWRMPPGEIGRGLDGVDRAIEGLPSDEAFIAAYCDCRGLSKIEDFEVYLAFCFFRMGAVLQGVHKRALDGNASNPERGLQMGTLVPQFARKGLEVLEHG